MKTSRLASLLCAVFSIPLAAMAQFTPYYMGSSTIDQINYNGVTQMAQQRAHPYRYGRHMIPGTSLDWLWNHPTDGFRENPYPGASTANGYVDALPNYEWSAVILTPADRRLPSDRDYGARFMNLTRTYSANSDTVFYVFSRWPRNELTNNSLPKLPATDPYHPGELDFSAQWDKRYTGGWDSTNWTRDYHEQLVEALRADVPGADVRMIPVGDVMYRLQQQMRAGEFAQWGLHDILDIYQDGAHFSNLGQYIAGSTTYATMFGEDPSGMALPAAFAPRVGTSYPTDLTITPDLAAKVQETVWDVVSDHPYAAVPEPAGAAVLLLGSLVLLRRRSA